MAVGASGVPPAVDLASLRPRPGDVVGSATRIVLRELGRRAQFLAGQIERIELMIPVVTARAPGLLALYGSVRTPRRCCSSRPATIPRGCATRPPGRRRADPGLIRQDRPLPAQPPGDRQANQPCGVVFTRMGSHPATRAYVERRTAEGLSKKEIIRCLKRYAAHEVYPRLRADA
jgi:hypothetical protein